MDIERTMEFILQQQAKTERRVEGIAKLVQVGMRMIVQLQEGQKETNDKLNALIEMVARHDEMLKRHDKMFERSDARFERLMAALLRKRTNGRGPRSS